MFGEERDECVVKMIVRVESNSEEIEVGRKVRRNGESEFFIAK